MSEHPGLTRKQRQRLQRYEQGLRDQESGTLPPAKPLKAQPPDTPSKNPGLVIDSLKNVLSLAGGLSKGERALLENLLLRYEAEQRQIQQLAQAKKREERQALKEKEKQEKQLRYSWQREQAEKIEQAHKVSGIERIPPIPLQGGAPGLGKKS